MSLEKIREMIAEFKGMDVSQITAETAFDSLGLDSLDVVDLIMQIEDETGVTVEMSDKIRTVGDVAAIIDGAK